MNSFFQNTAEIMWVFLAMCGGVARYLDRYIRTGKAPQLSMLASHTVVSGFSGFMVAQAVIKFQPDWALVAAGVGGYLGTQGLDWIASIFQDKFGGKMRTTDDTSNKSDTGAQ